MKIKEILMEIAANGGKIYKRDTLTKYKDNQLLKDVIYKAHSPRINYYIKQLPEYTPCVDMVPSGLDWGLLQLEELSSRKLTGNDGREHLKMILESLSPDDAYVIERIIDRNLKIGMSTGINKVISKLIEETPYQGAKSFSEKGARKLFVLAKKNNEPVISQVKADGTYRNAMIQDGIVELVSRQGELSFLKGTTFLTELKRYPNCVLNGEITIDGVKRTEANGMVSSMMDIIEKAEERGVEKTEKKKIAFEKKHGSFDNALINMRFVVWDAITIEEYQDAVSSVPYIQRLDELTQMVNKLDSKMVSLVETRYITTYQEAMEHFLDTQKRGLEGTIIKSSSAGWKDGKPTYQIKLKLEMTIDLRMVGGDLGDAGTKNERLISRIHLESSCGLLKTTASGMKEVMMKDITDNYEDYNGGVFEMRCCGLSQNSKGEWSTQHPSINYFRNDKDTCDSLESAIEIENMAKGLTKKINNKK